MQISKDGSAPLGQHSTEYSLTPSQPPRPPGIKRSNEVREVGSFGDADGVFLSFQSGQRPI